MLTIPVTLACGGPTGSADCSRRDNYTATLVWSIDIWKRNADIIYHLPNRSVELVEKLYPILDTEHPESDAYLAFFDRLFPRFPHPPLNNSFERSLEVLLFQYAQNSVTTAIWNPVNTGYIETLMLPWIIQQLGIQAVWIEDLPAENVITASYCKRNYKINFAISSFLVFTLICLLTTAWSLVLLVPNAFNTQAPILSWFLDANIMWKLPSRAPSGEGIPTVGTGATSTMLEHFLGNVGIKVAKRMRWDSGDLELRDLEES